MFQGFFGLREQPFGVTPDPRYLYLGPGHREALASLFYGIEANRGFLALIAKPGMGKTTLLFHLLEKFRNRARTAFLFQTQCSSREFMRFLLAEVGIDGDGKDFVQMHEEFNRCLLQEARAGNRFIIVIDEAQNLDPAVLETVRLLSDFETPRAKLLQIILSGQPELAEKLAHPGLNQLHQRIASFIGLTPLGAEETARFIDHRLRVAGYQGISLFTPSAIAMIAEFSGGIPRNINNLCFHSLSLAFALQKKTVDLPVVQEVAEDLDVRRLLANWDATSEPARSKPHFGLNLDYRQEWDEEKSWWKNTATTSAKRNGTNGGEIHEGPFVTRTSSSSAKAEASKPLGPDEARIHMQNVTRMLKDWRVEPDNSDPAPVLPDELP
jgi:general secretion pathway protein A